MLQIFAIVLTVFLLGWVPYASAVDLGTGVELKSEVGVDGGNGAGLGDTLKGATKSAVQGVGQVSDVAAETTNSVTSGSQVKGQARADERLSVDHDPTAKTMGLEQQSDVAVENSNSVTSGDQVKGKDRADARHSLDPSKSAAEGVDKVSDMAAETTNSVTSGTQVKGQARVGERLDAKAAAGAKLLGKSKVKSK